MKKVEYVNYDKYKKNEEHNTWLMFNAAEQYIDFLMFRDGAIPSEGVILPTYYKIGKHGKVESLTDDDYANLSKFPLTTIFFREYPEEGMGIKLDI